METPNQFRSNQSSNIKITKKIQQFAGFFLLKILIVADASISLVVF